MTKFILFIRPTTEERATIGDIVLKNRNYDLIELAFALNEYWMNLELLTNLTDERLGASLPALAMLN